MGFDEADRVRIQFAERDGRHPHASGLLRLHEGCAKHHRGIVDRNTIEVFVEGTHQHWIPESIDGAPRLAMTSQPGGKVLSAVFGNALQKTHHSSADGYLVRQRQRGGLEKGHCIVQRRGQQSGAQQALPSARLNEM